MTGYRLADGDSTKSAFVAGRLCGDTETGKTAVFSAVTGTDLIRGTGPVSPGNTAFTHWVEMLITAPDLTRHVVSKSISGIRLVI
ncbi:hypothetical protein [Proteus mirabilis]|uniref:hypothetical protein n=1 Tax=Proteus mirabilis TaxID=584 RepID=UPI001F5D78FD|nr:hypothetical protein [Proteus mirabilis]